MSEKTADALSIRLLVWDEPDVRAHLGAVLVGKPTSAPDVDLAQLYLWLQSRCEAGEVPHARLCTVVRPGEEETLTPWVTAARKNGFGVVLKPAGAGKPDFSTTILATLERFQQAGTVAELLVATHDADRLGARLEQVAASGVVVTVLGFRERATFAAASGRLGFIDLEAISGLWNVALPRTVLYDLPEEGFELEPLGVPAPVAAVMGTAPPAMNVPPARPSPLPVAAASLRAAASAAPMAPMPLTSPATPPMPVVEAEPTDLLAVVASVSKLSSLGSVPAADSPSVDGRVDSAEDATSGGTTGGFFGARVAPPPPPPMPAPVSDGTGGIFRPGRLIPPASEAD